MKNQTIIRETGLVEHTCKHGVGHPDYKSAKEMAKLYGHTVDTWLVHCCCGCCKEIKKCRRS